MCISITSPQLATPVEALGFFVPQKTRYQDILGPVNHKPAWSIWRGLSCAQAEELAVCELALRYALEEKVTAYIDGFHDWSAKRPSIFTIKVNLVELAAAITDVYFDICLPPSPLLQGQNILQFICLHDCFSRPVSTTKKACEARIRVETIQNGINPLIIAYPSKLVFDDLVVHVLQGQNYYLRPRYTPAFKVSKHSNRKPQVTYTTMCEWLRYSEEKQCFAGTVPQSEAGAQQIIVKARIVYDFPGTSVFFEEVLRADVAIFSVAPGAELELPTTIESIKQVRFASDTHAVQAPKDRSLTYHNSVGMIQNCSKMGRDGRRTFTSSSGSDNTTIVCVLSTAFELEEGNLSSHTGPEYIQADLQSLHKAGAMSVDDRTTVEDTPPAITSTELEEDGVSAQLCGTVRAMPPFEFDAGEDPRDVREMKKDLLQMHLQDLSKSMLGFRVDRWSSEEAPSVLSDIRELSEDSESESGLRESIG